MEVNLTGSLKLHLFAGNLDYNDAGQILLVTK
jgi:hypothetical protein